MKLHYKKSGKGKPLFILHGLLGMLDNWLGIGKVLSKSFEVFLLDARNHGHSPHSELFNYDVMAADLFEFIEDHKGEFSAGEISLIGHSMGGKTAMKFAQKYPDEIEKLVVVDISPGSYPVHNDEVFEALMAVDLAIVKSRKDAEISMLKFIQDPRVLQFVLKNLYWKEPGQLAWRFNFETIKKNQKKIVEATTDAVFNKPALFLKGDRSEYITEKDVELIKQYFPQSEIKTISGAGHWVHAEQPAQFVEEVIKFLA